MRNKCVTPPLPYITWGLIWDLKTKRRDSNIYKYKEYIFDNGEERRNNNKREKRKIHKELFKKS